MHVADIGAEPAALFRMAPSGPLVHRALVARARSQDSPEDRARGRPLHGCRVIGLQMAESLIDALREMAVRGLRRMYRRQERLFVFRLRRGREGVVLEGLSRRYTAIA